MPRPQCVRNTDECSGIVNTQKLFRMRNVAATASLCENEGRAMRQVSVLRVADCPRVHRPACYFETQSRYNYRLHSAYPLFVATLRAVGRPPRQFKTAA